MSPQDSSHSATRTVTLAEALRHAVGCQQSGRLAEAEAVYREILRVQPSNFDALHLLGVLHAQRGDKEESARLIEMALKIDDSSPLALSNYGNALQELGRLEQSVASYDRAIQLKPDYADAFYNRGNALQALRRYDDALASYDSAIALNPNYADAILNRGTVLKALLRLDEALADFDKVLTLRPNNIETQVNRGNALSDLGRLDEALLVYDQILALKPGDPTTLLNRANALQDLGRVDDALADINHAIANRPGYAEAYVNRGTILESLERPQEALESYDRAIALRPNYPQALLDRANVLQSLGRLEDAVADCDNAIKLRPDFAEAYNSRGAALLGLGRTEDAVESFDAAIANRPDFAQAYNNRGNAMRNFDLSGALASYDRAIALKPDYAEAYCHRGTALHELRRLDDALRMYDEAIVFKPDYFEAYQCKATALHELKRYKDALASLDCAIEINPNVGEMYGARGDILVELKRGTDALASYDRAIELKPDHGEAACGRHIVAAQACDWQNRRRNCEDLIARCQTDQTLVPWVILTATDSLQAQLGAAARQARHLARFAEGNRATNPKPTSTIGSDHPHIRVAYLSADFRHHPVAYLVAELLEKHDRAKFEIYGIALQPSDGSPIRARLNAAVQRMIDVDHLSDEEVGKLMAELGIDIAVDLTSHTKDGRLGIHAYRQVPVSMTYLGFAGTTGADYVDYILGDPFLIPPRAQPYYSERIAYLPDTYLVTDTTRAVAQRKPSRNEAGLPEQGIVFCCFNNSYKLTPEIFDVWMRLLDKIEGSVVWLNMVGPEAQANLRKEAVARGIDPNRLIVANFIPAVEDHLSRLRLADIFLDTLPYNAHSTAADALWAGVPVVTCSGESFASRVAGSLLHAVGLPELITADLAAYEALALQLAQDPVLLAGLKDKLSRHRKTYPLFDTDRFRKHLEAAYTMMWERHKSGLAPETFTVPSLGS